MISFSTYLERNSQARRPTPPHPGGLSRYLLQRRVCVRPNRLGRVRHFRWQRDRLRHDPRVRQLAVARPCRTDPDGIAGSERRARSFAADRGFKLLSGSTRCTATADPAADFGASRGHGSSNRAVSEGVSAHRQAILLGAITRVARIGLEVDRLTMAARQNVPRKFARWCGRKCKRRWTRSRRYWTSSPTKFRRTSLLARTNSSRLAHPRESDAGQSQRSHHPGQTNLYRQSEFRRAREFRRLHRFAGCADRTHRAPARRASAAARRRCRQTIWSRVCPTLRIPRLSDIP